MICGFEGSTAALNPWAPAGTPFARRQVRPSFVERKTPKPAYVLPPNALSPVTAISVPPAAGDHSTDPTVWVGSLLPIERQVLPSSRDSQTPPLATEA